MKNIMRAAVIGLGVGTQHAHAYRASPNTQLVGVCDFDLSKLAEFSKKYPDVPVFTDAQELIFQLKPEIVSIASFDNFHFEQIEAAILSGAHIFVEKPMCQNMEEFKKILDLKRQFPSSRIGTNFVLRNEIRFKDLRNKIKDGEFGLCYYFEGDYDYGRVHKLTNGWRGEIPFYSIIQGGAIHLIDLMMWLAGHKVTYVNCIVNKLVTCESDYKYYDFALISLTFENGCIGKVTANFGACTAHFHRVAAYGTKKTFLQNQFGSGYITGRGQLSTMECSKLPYPRAQKGDLLNEWVQAIISDKPSPVLEDEIFDVMSVVLAIEKSIEQNEQVKVKYLSY